MQMHQKLKWLRENRLKNPLKQSELSKMINVTRSQISKYESGDRAPTIDVLHQMAKVYNVTIDYLLSDKEYDLKRLDRIWNDLCEDEQRYIPMDEVVYECTLLGMKEREKRIDALDTINRYTREFILEIPPDFEEQYKKINTYLLNYSINPSSQSNEMRVKAILRALEVWGIYNDICIGKTELDLINSYLEFILVKSSQYNHEGSIKNG